jgi:hypothetical protein
MLDKKYNSGWIQSPMKYHLRKIKKNTLLMPNNTSKINQSN